MVNTYNTMINAYIKKHFHEKNIVLILNIYFSCDLIVFTHHTSLRFSYVKI